MDNENRPAKIQAKDSAGSYQVLCYGVVSYDSNFCALYGRGDNDVHETIHTCATGDDEPRNWTHVVQCLTADLRNGWRLDQLIAV